MGLDSKNQPTTYLLWADLFLNHPQLRFIDHRDLPGTVVGVP